MKFTESIQFLLELAHQNASCVVCGFRFKEIEDFVRRDPICLQNNQNGVKAACKSCCLKEGGVEGVLLKFGPFKEEFEK